MWKTNKVKIGIFNSASQFDVEEFTSQLNIDITSSEYFQTKDILLMGFIFGL